MYTLFSVVLIMIGFALFIMRRESLYKQSIFIKVCGFMIMSAGIASLYLLYSGMVILPLK